MLKIFPTQDVASGHNERQSQNVTGNLCTAGIIRYLPALLLEECHSLTKVVRVVAAQCRTGTVQRDYVDTGLRRQAVEIDVGGTLEVDDILLARLGLEAGLQVVV